jgi:hypothetical protein
MFVRGRALRERTRPLGVAVIFEPEALRLFRALLSIVRMGGTA